MSLLNTISTIQSILNAIIPVLVALGVVYFVWGVVTYFIAGGEEAKKTGRDRIIYGIIGLAVITSLWGLVNILVKTFGLEGSSAPSLAPLTGGSGGCAMGNTVGGLATYITCIINNSIIPLIFALAVVMFVWGVVNFFIIGAGEEAKRTQGKQFMIWGIVALAVMLSVWGLVYILAGTFGIRTNILPQVCPPGAPNCAPANFSGGGGPGSGGPPGGRGPGGAGSACTVDSDCISQACSRDAQAGGGVCLADYPSP